MNEQSNEINHLVTALVKVQAKLKGALKDASNPFFKSKYADLESVWDACRVPLTENGLCVIQTTDRTQDGETVVVTTLAHSSGQWIKGALPVRSVKSDPQAQGAAITYARRYALAAIVGVIQVDDDAESAMDRQNSQDAPEQGTQSAQPSSVPRALSARSQDMARGQDRCEHRFMVSKFNQNEEYCTHCRVTRPRSA